MIGALPKEPWFYWKRCMGRWEQVGYISMGELVRELSPSTGQGRHFRLSHRSKGDEWSEFVKGKVCGERSEFV